MLRQIVAFCFSQLEAYVRAMSPEGLLEFMLERNEAAVRADARQRLVMPTRLACFAEVGDVVKEIKDQMSEIAKSGLAGRFLIEYVAAQSPRGFRKISLLAYNELRALAEQIIVFGMSSDAVHYDLTDLELAILPSGRLGRSELRFRTAQEAHITQVTGERIARLAERFDQYWPKPDGSSGNEPELVQKLDDASMAEFGFSMTDLGVFLSAVRRIGFEQSYGIASMSLERLAEALASDLKWSNEKVASAIDLFSLCQRETYLTPASSYPIEDLYPWRYNRGLSYLRRPLILRGVGSVTEVLWGNRHVEATRDNLLALCLTGQLKAKSLPMRQLMGGLRHGQGERFNDRVAGLAINTCRFENSAQGQEDWRSAIRQSWRH